MKQTDILLTAINAKYIHSNLAIYSLRENAGPYRELVELVEFTINHRPEEILRGVYGKNPRVIGFSCYIWNIAIVLEVAENLKKVLPGTMIVVGGPEVSYDASKVLEKYPFLDVVMVGEGEQTFREFAAWYAQGTMQLQTLSQIDGLCLRGEEGETIFTPPRRPAVMDELVFPYRNLSGMENRIIYYETIRGCPFSCSYCLSSIEKSVRFRNLSLVYEELGFFLENRVKQVKFVDRTFNCRHEHAYRIWSYICEHDNGVTNFHFEIGGDLLREEDFELLAACRPGLIQFEIGVQSVNPRTLAEIRRETDLGKLAGSIARIREGHNIHQHLDLIAGLPYEDYESFRHSFCDVYAMRPDQLQLGFLKVLKGSRMEAAAPGYKIQYGSRPPYEVLATGWLSYGDVLALKRVEEMVEIHYNSFQFQATMSLLEIYEKDAFSLYERLGNWYEKKGYDRQKHSRMARYEILWEYIGEYFSEYAEQFRQTLTYDLFLRDYVKSPPSFVVQRSPKYLSAVRRFLEEEANEPVILRGYGGMAARHLFHMVYVNEFTADFGCLLTDRKWREREPVSLLFDYEKRDPLNHNARVVEVILPS